VPGVLATRILETRRERFICSILISIVVPCAALQAMIFGLVGPDPPSKKIKNLVELDNSSR